jgi:hypothetical protein
MSMDPVGPSWQPDPSGRHQFRWWTGAGWGDAVADSGQVSRDPIEAVPSLVMVGEAARRGAVTPGAAPRGDATALEATAVAEMAEMARVIPTTVPTYDPDGARLADVPRPKRPRPPLGRWLVYALVVIALVGVAVLAARAWWGNRATPAAAQVLTLEEPGAGLGREFTVTAGNAVRVRVELGPDMVVEAYVLAADGEVAADLTVAPIEAAGNGRVVGERAVVVQLTGSAVLTAALVAGESADAELTLFVVATEGSGAVRTIVESYGGVPAGADRSASEVLESDFFSDADFFSDTAPYEPAG